MFDLLHCMTGQHDQRLVLLAALICCIAAMGAVLLLRHARHLSGKGAAQWVAGAGIAVGFGIWATHFVAMLGYDPGIVVGYDMAMTIVSLAVAIAVTTTAFFVALAWSNKKGLLAGSLLFGSGIAAMHYIGMSALELPATMHWRAEYVLASLVFAIVPTYPALVQAVSGRSWRSGIAAALLMTLAIVLLHFTGMAALRFTPAALERSDGMMLSRGVMIALVTAGSLGLLTTCIALLALARKARLARHASDLEMRILIRGITDCAIYMLDRDAHVVNWNAGAQRLKGYDADEAIGLPLADFYTPEDRASNLPEQAVGHALATGKFSGEGWRVRRDGNRFWAHVTIEKVSNENGDHIGFAKITRDMTRFKEDEDRLRKMAGHLDAALGNMYQGLCLFDAQGRLLMANPRFSEIWGLDPAATLRGKGIDVVIRSVLAVQTASGLDPDRVGVIRRQIAECFETPGGPPVAIDCGEALVVSMASRGMPDGGRVMTFEDITERRRSEAKIAHMAMHDSLTGLPNRSAFAHWVDAELEQARHFGHQLAVVMIDLDRFKEINDTRGHGAGDLALQHLAKRLLDVVNDREVVARLGGDEFAAAKRFRDKAELAVFLDRLEACFATPFGSEDNGFHLGGSLGVAIFPHDGEWREQILNNADLAMYRAKGNLGERIAYYEPAMDEHARARRQIANDLRQAIDRDQLSLVYQAQHSLVDDRLNGYEALLRWNHPTKGAASPVEFIPVAEETGEIFRIGEWVLREACREARNWPQGLKVAVNLSAVQLLQPDLADVVRSILVETGMPPSRLELEITETAIIADKIRALHLLRQIKALGVSIAIDDFGTGYSSLDTLHSFPFDKIKIDKSFVLKSQHSIEARAIIKAVLALGHSLSMPVLAEGVETPAQAALLKEQGCDEAQGYYFGRPGQAPGVGFRRVVEVG